jgi:hypothetical protein
MGNGNWEWIGTTEQRGDLVRILFLAWFVERKKKKGRKENESVKGNHTFFIAYYFPTSSFYLAMYRARKKHPNRKEPLKI